MKNNLLFAVFAFTISYASALKCYNCISTSPNKTCFTPMNKTQIPTITCNKTSSNFYQFLNTTHLNPMYVQEALNATEYECVTYIKNYTQANVTEVGRGCFPRTHYVNSCQALHIAGENSHHLMECDVCQHDNCNGSPSIVPTSGFLLLAFVISKIYLK